MAHDAHADSSRINTVPITVKMILNDAVYDKEAGRFRVADKVVHKVRVVGTCASMRDVSDTMTIVYLNDCTGTLAVVFSVPKKDQKSSSDGSDDDILVHHQKSQLAPMEFADVPPAQRHIEPDVYYEVTGLLTWMRRKRGMPRSHAHLCVHHARRVTDMNQITHHQLECIHTHLLMTRGPLSPPKLRGPDGEFFVDLNEGASGDVVDDDFF